ncbi:hypothetical protein Vafri_5497 [Volvox africanus]|uniref:Uncharacterized protein n=1 Tax=Volvox africanus TaxID=51714 RepID=A0A8J4EUZ6_9CHLO|nr:hypothetical protein Vafri_5497 [Volvox africanus]
MAWTVPRPPRAAAPRSLRPVPRLVPVPSPSSLPMLRVCTPEPCDPAAGPPRPHIFLLPAAAPRSSSISRCRFVGRRDARAGAVTVSPSQRSCISSTDVPSPTPPTSPLLGPSLGSC